MRFFGLVLALFLLISCGTQKISITNNNKELTYLRGNKSYKTQYLLDLESNNTFTLVELKEKPQPIQGQDQMINDMYMVMQYPASAREKNIQGTVLLESVVDKTGGVESVTINRSLDDALDREAIRIYKLATKDGFEPFIYKGKPTGFKYIFPVNFKLK